MRVTVGDSVGSLLYLCYAKARGIVLNWTLVSCKGKGNWTLVSCKGKGKCVELDPCVLQRQGEMC